MLAVLAVALASCVRTPGDPTDRDRRVRDVDAIVKAIADKHPRPFRRMPAEEFARRAEEFRRDAARLEDDEAAVRLMQLVAGLRDGHTCLFPVADDRWFPLRFYELSDGVYLTATPSSLRELGAARVLRIGRTDIAEAVRLARSAFSSDNDFGAQAAVTLFSSPRVLHGLHIIDTQESLPLTLELRNGARREVTVGAVNGKSDWDWIYWGEMYGPARIDLVAAVNGRPSLSFRDPAANPDLPSHLRTRRAFWITRLEPERAVYAQINAMADRSTANNQTFGDFVGELFRLVDGHPADKLVLDIRYNSGGNGDLVNALLHQVIKRDAVNRKGRLFLITGGKTFSAAVGLLVAFLQHTEVTLVGEPAGAGLNSAGDADSLILPSGAFRLNVSTNVFVGGKFKDESSEIPVEFPAPLTGADYFGGRDPALEIAAGPTGERTVLGVLRGQGGDAAQDLYASLKRRFGSISWWQPFAQAALNDEGYKLLEGERIGDAVAAFSINADRFPKSWEVWDSLAEGLMAAGRPAEAIAAYEKALSLAPDNWNAAAEKKAIEKMRGAVNLKR